MIKETLFTMETPYREPLPVYGWKFGNPDIKTLAIMGAMRGNEIQQMYICSRLVKILTQLEKAGELSPDCGIMVMPCANQFSMNVGSRFWAADNTDINRMFPGYIEGETTQRIAARIFESLQGYNWGIQMTSFHLPGDFLPHVRMMETGYEKPEEALAFGLPYVVLRTPKPYDTTTLNYNWQVWNTQAFSMYTRETDDIDTESAEVAVNAVLHFLSNKGLLHRAYPEPDAPPRIFRESELKTVLSASGGIFIRKKVAGDTVIEGDVLAEILDPCTGEILEKMRACCTGRIFFTHKARLINGHEVAFRIL